GTVLDGGCSGEAAATLKVGTASGASALGYAPPAGTVLDGGRSGEAAATLKVGTASGASALGYAPPPGRTLGALVIREEIDQSDDRDERDDPDRDPLEDESEEDDEERHRLRGGRDPREVAAHVPLHGAPGQHVEREHDHADHEHRPAREVVRDGDDDALDHRHPERELQL